MSDDAEIPKVPIRIDPSHGRHFADSGYAYFLGRDVEIAFVQRGPALFQPAEPDDDGVTRGIFAESARSEVARVRLPMNGSLNLATDILEEVLSSDNFRSKKLRKRLQGFIEQLDAKEAEFTAGTS